MQPALKQTTEIVTRFVKGTMLRNFSIFSNFQTIIFPQPFYDSEIIHDTVQGLTFNECHPTLY